jgi:iron complex transport system permease protein
MKATRNLTLAAFALAVVCLVSVAHGEMGWLAPWKLVTDAAGDGRVLRELRLPRTLLGLFAGASLGVSGALMQGFFRNPVAEPYVIGVSSGAAFGAVAVLAAGMPGWVVSLAAFAGAGIAAALVCRLATRDGVTSPLVLLLGGMAIAGFLQALTMGLLLRVDPFGMRSVVLWLMGSLAYRGWEHVAIAAVGWIPGMGVAMAASRVLDLLSAGEDSAASLGVPVETVKRLVIGVSCLMAGTAVASCGIIAYAGLMAPHLARLLVGGRHGMVLPGSALFGALLLTASDLLARHLLPGQELPVGVITGVIGALFLVGFLLMRGRFEA